MSEIDWLDDDEERGLESTAMTNREKIINYILTLNDDEFTKFVCKQTRCTSCPAKPLREECHERLKEWLLQETDND